MKSDEAGQEDIFLTIHRNVFPDLTEKQIKNMTDDEVNAYCARACRVIDSWLRVLERRGEYHV
jgi:hypothetical protein